MEARIEQVPAAAPAGHGGTPAPVNAWIIGDDDEVIVVDPGRNADAVLDAVGEREVLAVICTHGHAGHTAAAVEVAGRDDAQIALHRRDMMLWRETHPDGDAEIEMEDGGIFEVGGVALEVIHAPGHTPGSVCLYCEELEAVFSGDALLAAGPAPHDGDFPDLPAQLTAIGERLLTLPGRTRILPGHGAETTVSVAERRFDSWVTAGPSGPPGSPSPGRA
jgi:glyoxylase-like metal-dependent hydrolase (beta-lactamase superfamily II)